MSDPIEQAALPSLIAVLQAAQTLVANLGTDPAQLALKLPGAFAVFLGTVQLQVPALAGAEIGAVQTDINAKLSGMITSLQAKLAK